MSAPSPSRWVLLVAPALLSAACWREPAGAPDASPPNASPPTVTPGPCTDPQKCCSKEEMTCWGDPESGVICACPNLWDCASPDSCQQDLPTPDRGLGWACTWTEFKYTCAKKGSNDSPPAADADWHCVFAEQEVEWVCIRSVVPNPTNVPWGTEHWRCKVDAANNLLICKKAEDSSHPDPGIWSCTSDGKICKKSDDNGGLPPGGGSWKCHRVEKNGIATWICYGQIPDGSTPGGDGWVCVKVKTELDHDIYRCERAELSSDYPPGGGWYACVKGSAYGGTVCTETAQAPQPPGPIPKPGSSCAVGDRMWCDGLVYSGWGQVACDPATGTWKTTVVNGKTMLDCDEALGGGKVPDTVCACYHYFLNPSCCEQIDCILPKGTSGQICPKSQGRLCDHCNPLTPECAEPGAKCIVTNSHETFCGRDCSSGPCPADYTCMTVKLKVGTTKQCVPSDMSCYY